MSSPTNGCIRPRACAAELQSRLTERPRVWDRLDSGPICCPKGGCRSLDLYNAAGGDAPSRQNGRGSASGRFASHRAGGRSSLEYKCAVGSGACGSAFSRESRKGLAMGGRSLEQFVGTREVESALFIAPSNNGHQERGGCDSVVAVAG